ncbi:type I-E CRISPR-associated protein Cas7/Cse4/CasC [Actinomycetota bacterium]|nr:type I-E CRISPR-associated protein Cas7/Cse4/CasC [Actinomycetota bacterium]
MTRRTIVDLHVLQTVPPSNLNRDDTGSPKTAKFGGTTRARVSSQAWKRATRVAFNDLLRPEELGVRTKRVVELLAARITELDPALAEEATALAETALTAAGIKLAKVKRTTTAGESENFEAGYLVFLSRQQITKLAEAAVAVAGDDDRTGALKKSAKGLLNTDHSVDVALFGRMVADDSDLSVDACAQVAHAISVHQVANEFDYFTAVDDVKNEAKDEDAGAGMIGTVEFNSSTLYRYATLDVDRLSEALGTTEATRRATEAFVRAFVESMPTGKQNTFANRTLPDAIVVTVRDTQSINLVGAFEAPVTALGDDSRLTVAARRLAERATEVEQVLGQRPVQTWVVALGDARKGLDGGAGLEGDRITLPELSGAIGSLVEERLGASQ